jgi:hypothetical protein
MRSIFLGARSGDAARHRDDGWRRDVVGTAVENFEQGATRVDAQAQTASATSSTSPLCSHVDPAICAPVVQHAHAVERRRLHVQLIVLQRKPRSPDPPRATAP